ncbi:hypothetical protein ABT083_25395 [Streptomyces goshikiensis]|uniref:hypothetical protein n=1 Tax=Streptomyces goshikiensis TaxID=1942 RepID=UPI003323787F
MSRDSQDSQDSRVSRLVVLVRQVSRDSRRTTRSGAGAGRAFETDLFAQLVELGVLGVQLCLDGFHELGDLLQPGHGLILGEDGQPIPRGHVPAHVPQDRFVADHSVHGRCVDREGLLLQAESVLDLSAGPVPELAQLTGSH